MVYALSIGVDYKTFWSLSPKKLILFAEAEKLKIQNQDFMNYVLGLYVRTAVASVLDKKAKYPSEPMLKNITNNQKFDDDLFMAQMKQFADIHNANIRKKRQKESG